MEVRRWSVVSACLSVVVLASAIRFSQQQRDSTVLPSQADACTIPPSVSLDQAATGATSELDELLLEGKCFLACLELEPDNTRRHETYPAWPYATVRSNCNKGRLVHECTRGCSIWARYSATQREAISSTTTCSSDCVAMCSEECAGEKRCDNPDTLDPWLLVTCQLSCVNVDVQCTRGCELAGTFVDVQPPTIAAPTEGEGSTESLLDPNSIPPGPISPPNLVYLTPTEAEDAVGAYGINLIDSVPDLEGVMVIPGDLSPVAFLFRIEKEGSDPIYIWQYDPTSPLLLTQYLCQNISVSLAVVNKMGRSDFTQPLHLTVEGDGRRIPNPPLDLTFQHWEDTRVGYFGHFVLRLTLLGPVDDRYLDNFTLHILNPSNSNISVVQTLPYTGNGTVSTMLMSDLDALTLLMTKNYRFTVTSVGIDGATSLEKTKLFSNVISSDLSITCQRIWDGNRYFSFIIAWTIPPHWASNRVSAGFHLQPYLNITGELLASISDLPLQNGKIDYTKLVSKDAFPASGRDFFTPKKTSEHYRFDLTVNWAATTHGSTAPRRCYLDSTSPRPSPVRNFTIRSTEKSNDALTLHLEWLSPIDANGVLDAYQICLSLEQLRPDQELDLGGSSQCTEADISSLNIRHTWKILTTQCLYCQMRARNTFVPGNWTEPLLVESVAGSCIDPTDAPISNGVIYASVSVILVLTVVGCLICLVFFLRLKRRRKRFLRRVEAHDPLFAVNRSTYRRPTVTTPTGEPLLATDEWEVPPSEIIVEDSLGEGAFGEVYKGLLKGPIACSKVRQSQRKAVCTEVAIKLLKTTAKGSERQDFLSEIDTMKKVTEGHSPHVVGMLGCVTLQEPLCLVTEFVKYGDLLSYLRTNRKLSAGEVLDEGNDPYLRLGQLSSSDLVSFAYQISSGMEYLSSIGIVHRDLACRNILVDEGKVLKITDFGMSRETEEIYIQQSKGRVPFKWMAIESILTREFTSASDVWSYGIVLWEIGTIGGVPYPSIQNQNLLSLLNRGYRMERPENCSTEIYDIMLSCWNESPRMRPSFAELKSTFDRLLLVDRKGDYIEFSLNRDSCHLEVNLETTPCTTLGLVSLSPSQRRRSHVGEAEGDDCKLLLLNDGSSGGDCQRNSRFSLGKWSPGRQKSPQAQQQKSSRQSSPCDQRTPKCQQSPKSNKADQFDQLDSCKASAADKRPARQHSPILLFPGRRSPGSVTPQNPSPFHSLTSSSRSFGTEPNGTSQRERLRPVSLLLGRDRGDRGGVMGEDRYVREPTNLANLNQTTNRSMTGLQADGREESQHLRLRRGSEGTLNMNSDGYVSFVGAAYGRDQRAVLPIPPPIQITVTEDL